MRDSILSFPQQLKRGIQAAEGVSVTAARNFICCGMGGSSVAGEVLSLLKENVVVHWDYALPTRAQDGDLVVCTSWSGETEETISSFAAAKTQGLDTLVITTGGTLADRAREEKSPLIIIPGDAPQPRAGEGFMIGALFAALGARDELPSSLEPASLEQRGKDFAVSLAGRVAVIYSAYPWRKVTGWFKTLLNENAKLHAFSANLPSAAHNELTGWTGKYQDVMVPVFVRDTADSPEYSRTLDAMLAILGTMGYNVLSLELVGTTVVEKALNAYILGLWASLYSAQMRSIDPVDTSLINEFKKLKKK